MDRQWMLGLSLFYGLSVQPTFAQDRAPAWSFTIGARTWYEDWTYEDPKAGKTYTYMEDVLLWGPVASVRYQKFALTLNSYSGSYHQDENTEGRSEKIERQRDDIDLILTYRIRAPLSIGIGYKYIGDSGNRQKTVLQDPNYTFDEWEWDGGFAGPVVGLSLNQYLYRRLFITGVFSYTWLKYDSEDERWHQDFADPSRNYYRITAGDPIDLHAATLEMALGWTFFRHIVIMAGYRYQHIGPAREDWWPDTIKGPIAGIYYSR